MTLTDSITRDNAKMILAARIDEPSRYFPLGAKSMTRLRSLDDPIRADLRIELKFCHQGVTVYPSRAGTQVSELGHQRHNQLQVQLYKAAAEDICLRNKGINPSMQSIGT